MRQSNLPPLQIAPLQKVSPSGFSALSQCLLRAACQAARQPSLMPQSPSGSLGSIAHKVLEMAGKREASGDVENFAEIWDELVEKVEEKWQALPLQRHFVPLRNHVPRYQVLRWQTCQQAARIASQFMAGKSKISTETVRVFHEEPVATPDGIIAGIIDYVCETPQGTLLRDYKTGTVWGEAAQDGFALLKTEYQTQLKLYAALWWSQSGQWPLRLELVPLDDAPVEVLFEPQECSLLLQEARLTLENINIRIRATLQEPSPDLVSLAAPDAKTCRYCNFRPGCAAYWWQRERVPTEESDEWPKDVRGILEKKQLLGNGQWMLQMLSGAKPKNFRAPQCRCQALPASA